MIRQWDLQVMVIPALLFVIVFSYIPMWGLLMAFQDFNIFNGFMASPWVGLKHFQDFFHASDFWIIMRNTIVISFLKLLIGFPAPIILALMLNEVRILSFKKVVQTISYIPHFISMVIATGLLINLLSVDHGSINELLMYLNIIDSPVNWLSTPEYFWSILVSLGIWKDVGFGAIIYVAAIAGIDPQLYEAAQLDGASRFKQIFAITLPCIMPVIIIFLILAISNTLNIGFEEILLLTNKGANAVVKDVSDIVDTYVYRVGIQSQRYSYATAVGVFKSIVSVMLLVLANAASRKFSNSSLW
ncbi:ABC transporter permease subunit [Paenibacillus sp. LHD-117]|uniref:ABC transporter permease n=1 Tax=Paenibacillus sp. LHD-117 TaxID=3071412 RepID=UPI0027E1A19A|nr:ABC transporter permease subunit [Paenibacillus sp. LHD-117]MDQ6422962.1 ABC transporter permease subunit [Paenibacillus sp. LHD-117]